MNDDFRNGISEACSREAYGARAVSNLRRGAQSFELRFILRHKPDCGMF
jgi:hypothetical protein